MNQSRTWIQVESDSHDWICGFTPKRTGPKLNRSLVGQMRKTRGAGKAPNSKNQAPKNLQHSTSSIGGVRVACLVLDVSLEPGVWNLELPKIGYPARERSSIFGYRPGALHLPSGETGRILK